MHEFSTISASSYDPSALAAKLSEKSAEGWSVVSIVSTGGDITAFISRESDGSAVQPAAQPQPETSITVADTTADSVDASAATEPAGWAVAPEPTPAVVIPAAVVVEPTPTTPTPAPAAVSTPSVPSGWYADPAGRFELRYWDGNAWTEHVSRAGQQFTDPPVA